MTAGSPAPYYTLMKSESFMVLQVFGESPDISGGKYPFSPNPGVSVCQTHSLIFSAECEKKVSNFPLNFPAALIVTFVQMNAKKQLAMHASFNMVE